MNGLFSFIIESIQWLILCCISVALPFLFLEWLQNNWKFWMKLHKEAYWLWGTLVFIIFTYLGAIVAFGFVELHDLDWLEPAY